MTLFPSRFAIRVLSALVALAAIATARSATADDAAPANQVHIATYNIRYLNNNDGPDHWRNRVDAVAAYLADKDVFGLQEATAKQIDDLAERLPQFDWYGLGRTDGERGGEATPVFWRKDRFTAAAKDTFWLGPDPKAVGVPAWGANLPRVASWVLLTPVAPETQPAPFLVFNTHFDHQSPEARNQSATLILKEMTRIAEGRPAILMGDLNCRPDSEPIARLTAVPKDDQTLQLVDMIKVSETDAVGPTGTFNSFREINQQGRIDYLFVRPGLGRVLQHITDDPKTAEGRFASDHQPIRVIVAF